MDDPAATWAQILRDVAPRAALSFRIVLLELAGQAEMGLAARLREDACREPGEEG